MTSNIYGDSCEELLEGAVQSTVVRTDILGGFS